MAFTSSKTLCITIFIITTPPPPILQEGPSSWVSMPLLLFRAYCFSDYFNFAANINI
ncbi:hypothetical protein LguiA_023464 [Lonicera macranthoides]